MTFFLLARAGVNRAHVRAVPVIFVPGIMGSRLEFDELADEENPSEFEHPPDWDPDGYWMAEWLMMKSSKMRRILHHTHGARLLTDGPHSDDELQRGWGTIANTYYGSMLRHLRDSIAVIGAECPVYAFGYDWRKSNADSAKTLKTFVAKTLKAHLATEAILVTHSMGGIVVREAVRDEWMKNATLGVVHIAQPAGGAPVTYRRCFDGASFMTDGAKMAQLMGTTGVDLFNIFTAMPSAMQLLPFDQVRTAQSDWLRKRQPADGGKFVPWQGISHTIGGYKSQYHPPSLAPEINQPHLRRGDDEEARRLWAQTRFEADDRLTEANQFYKTLQLRTHPNTWSLASTGVETDTHVCFDLPAEGLKAGAALDLAAGRTDEGDGTVPLWSAFCVNTTTFRLPLDEGSDPELAFNFEGSGLVHDEICDDADVQGVTVSVIETMLTVVLREGTIEFRGPEFLRRALLGSFGDRAAQAEIRVAKWLREVRGSGVLFNENPQNTKSHDLFADGIRVEVKYCVGEAAKLAEQIDNGIRQVAFDGEVILVVGRAAAERGEPQATYEAVRDAKQADAPNVRFTFVAEDELPPFIGKGAPKPSN
jgi:hypothetical protein